ncbi:hypothetical protein KAH94_01445 [bacterium]|nr:hypothetical protein [bacterium]
MDICLYYQAHLEKKDCWFFVAILRSFEHLAFDRTLDKKTSLFEIFVIPSEKLFFEKLMKRFQEIGIVLDFQELPNRLLDPNEKL